MTTGRFMKMTGARRGYWLWPAAILSAAALLIVLFSGCARFNTFHNAKKAFDKAEQLREDRIRNREDVTKPTNAQKTDYQKAIKKCQFLLEEYPGHGLTDDALFLMAKSYHRLQSYRMSISRLDLLFQNFPSNKFMEEAIFLQAVNYMFIGNATASNEFLTRLRKNYPQSRFQAEALRLSGDNAYSLERWKEARDDFREYLAVVSKGVETGDAEYKLAQCHWMLKEYDEAAALLELASPDSENRDVYLDKRLLLARCLLRDGAYEQTEEILDQSDEEAAVYGKSGMVLMVRAENLVAQGRADEAAPLIENMPDEWRTADVAARLAEILGYIYLDKWQLEEAQTQFRATLRNPKILEDPDRARLINKELGRYLQMETRLDSANPEEAPALKLVQANALLGALREPRRALDLYLDLTRTADLDSASAVRGLFGAAITYRDYLDLPDSSAIMVDRLLSDYPDSPQAFAMNPESRGNLFDFLMEQDALRMEVARTLEPDTAQATIPAAGSEETVAAAPAETVFSRTTPPDSTIGRVRHHRRPKELR